MPHSHKTQIVWTLVHKQRGDEITVVLPEGFMPDEEWEVLNVFTVEPREDSEDVP